MKIFLEEIIIEKAIYGLAADYGTVMYNIKENGEVKYFSIEQNTVKYAKNIALTLEHEPKEVVTTTKNKENGQLIVVQKGQLLFFKFIPTTRDGERIYRYVKQRKFRQCSYTCQIVKSIRDLDHEHRMKWMKSDNETISVNHVEVFEVCLTNNPRDKNTFCTTDANHPLFSQINWETNVIFSEIDHWEQALQLAEMDEKLDELQQELEQLDKQSKKVLKERGILL